MQYLVNYEIPSDISEDRLSTAAERLLQQAFKDEMGVIEEGRSEEYEELYKRLDKVGTRLMTSCYLVDYAGTAAGLLEYITKGLRKDLLRRIKVLVTEYPENRACYQCP